jgi:hypothetical protein
MTIPCVNAAREVSPMRSGLNRHAYPQAETPVNTAALVG